MKMPEMDRKLRQVAQLRAIWRGFREPQERSEDERLSRAIIKGDSSSPQLREPGAAYGFPAIRAAIRHWWCERRYSTIVEFGECLDANALDAEPLLRIYIEEARTRLTKR